ncbi:MAG: sulfite exporter TauE/SafE family protein [Kiritimatiellae bacterium]|jgi:uncharacterized membrane protein YfcA|nr:sulfite exporter TauE/SafE family protein [Kiritimatiellia bacterium]
MEFSLQQVLLLSICAALVGAHKTGLNGAGALSIPISIAIFGAKSSTGVLLPILIMADIFAVAHYVKYTNWSCIVKLVPGSVIGVMSAVLLGQYIDDNTFKKLIATAIIVCLLFLVVQKKHKHLLVTLKKSKTFAGFIGVLGGFASMIGNAAGGIYSTYFISMELNKNMFIGTTAITFFLLNLFKLPFHIFVWKTITLNTFLIDLCTIPGILIGGFLGVKIVKLIPDKYYRGFIIVMTIISAIILLYR